MDWKDHIRARAASTGRALYESPLGLGLDFADGCDAFWILPGEVTSTLPVPPEGPASVDALLAAYDAIDHVRDRALHVVRHYVASKGIRILPSRSGHWGLTSEGASSSISVGAHLTAVARDTNDVYEAVRACVQNTWLRKVPSRRRIDRYLGTPGRPTEPPDTSAPAARTSTVRTALAWMGACDALDHLDPTQSATQVPARAAPTGRIARMLARIADRLPDQEAHAGFMGRGQLSITFDDGDASYAVNARSREIVRRIAADGPPAVGDQLADEYLALNAARARTLRAIRQAAAARGWRRQALRIGFLTKFHVTYLGHTRREVGFDPSDDLTNRLRGATPEAVLRQLFADTPDFADDCVAALRNPLPDAAVNLPDAELAPRDCPPAPPLRSLDDATLAELDRFAADTLRAHLADPRTLWKYRGLDAYDPAIDTWATPADWVAAADRQIAEQGRPHPASIVILLDADDPRGDALARQYLADAQPHHEVSDFEVELAWRYRHALPDVARRWFVLDANGDDVPFAQARATLADPVALRFATIDHVDDDPEYDPAAAEHLDPAARETFHAELLAWARTSYRWSPPELTKIRAALRMNWPDVADALAENPWLLAGLLTRDRRGEQLDEPGLLLASDFVLAWSRLSPSPFLARLLATAHGTDLVGLAEAASRHAVTLKPEAAAGLEGAFAAYRTWLKDVHVAIAIAWTRCRTAQGAGSTLSPRAGIG